MHQKENKKVILTYDLIHDSETFLTISHLLFSNINNLFITYLFLESSFILTLFLPCKYVSV